MNKEATTHKEKTSNVHKAGAPDEEKAKKEGTGEGMRIDSLVRMDSLLSAGSWQRVALGVAAAAGGGLLAAAVIGVGPAALAGTAGYLAYRGLTGHRTSAHEARKGGEA